MCYTYLTSYFKVMFMKKAKIIVLAGQSNAVGVGWVDYLPKHFTPDTVARFMSGYKNVLINYFSHDKKSDGFVPVSVGCTEVLKNTIGPEVSIVLYDSDCTVKLGNLFAERI